MADLGEGPGGPSPFPFWWNVCKRFMRKITKWAFKRHFKGFWAPSFENFINYSFWTPSFKNFWIRPCRCISYFNNNHTFITSKRKVRKIQGNVDYQIPGYTYIRVNTITWPGPRVTLRNRLDPELINSAWTTPLKDCILIYSTSKPISTTKNMMTPTSNLYRKYSGQVKTRVFFIYL